MDLLIKSLQDVVGSSEYHVVLYYLVTLFGATAMYVFSLNKGFDGAVGFLKKVFPGRTDSFYYRVDFLIVSFAGSIIGTIFFSPTNNLQVLAAGFGWVGTVNVLLHQGTRADG